MTRHGLVFGMKYLNFLFDFAGIYHFKSRFRPRYEGRYICALPGTTLRSALALFRMSGMVAFNLKTSRLESHAEAISNAVNVRILPARERSLRMGCQPAE